MAGGFDEYRQPIAAAELFMPDSRTFEPVSPMLAPRGEHLATLLSDGRVLMVDAEAVAADAYDPTEEKFVSLGNRRAGQRQAAVTLSNGLVLLLGSERDERELFDPSTNGFAPLDTGMILPADLGRVTAAVRLGDRRLGIFGTQSFVRVDPEEPCEPCEPCEPDDPCDPWDPDCPPDEPPEGIGIDMPPPWGPTVC